MSYISYLFLRLFIESFRLIPFGLLYRLSDGMAFLLHRVLGYRKNVIFDNLRRAFPEKTDSEMDELVKDTYRNLADITLETIKSFVTPIEEIHRRCVWTNIEKANACLQNGQTIIISGSHFASWEWPCMSTAHRMAGPTFCTYKPLNNPYVNAFYNRCRSRDGIHMISMEDTGATIRKSRDLPSVYFLVGDQSPGNLKNAQWIDFFGQDTPFLPGIDFLARRYKYPVYYINVQRIKRGFYTCTFEEIWTEPAAANEADITRAYAAHMENIIRQTPGNWLWSHKRWKHRRTAPQP